MCAIARLTSQIIPPCFQFDQREIHVRQVMINLATYLISLLYLMMRSAGLGWEGDRLRFLLAILRRRSPIEIT